MPNYETLSKEIEDRISSNNTNTLSPFAYPTNTDAVRRSNRAHDKMSVLRSPFIRDIDKILNCPYYNRYSDKTQVFSLYKNDDITHRSLHVQLVSRTAKTIGKALGLNQELIEAIALGHDIGHTPFGHTGEYFLDEIYQSHTNRRFAHNVHAIRVLDTIYPLNLTLPTLSGILAHNGELELDEYKPVPC
ncbi:MAG: HD domain-containing protein, partial [Clostridia bacterium]|nr:HD domain-containing protein [Clostridia bacterium]